MAIKLYNTLSRKLESFKPIKKERVSLYACGPTVYDYAQIGNLRSFLFEDTLKRVLQYNGYIVYSVMNITDVGHLVNDSDNGQDKMEKGAQREQKTAWEVAKFYEQAFFNDLTALDILPYDHHPRATDFIPQQIGLIAQLEKRGFTYTTEDGVYFNTSLLPTYGALAKLDIEHLQAGARVEMNQKKHPTDFALWKFSPINSDIKRDMEWDSPWGVGFPSWHTECVVMSDDLLHATFDIHTGGIDHIPVHHTNEIAQFEALHNKALAHYWLHNNFLLIKNNKMSKSAGNFYRLQDIIDKGFEPAVFRFFCLQAHYRSELDFSWENLERARQGLNRIHEFLGRAKRLTNKKNPEVIFLLKKAKKEFKTALNNDLDTPKALAILFDLIKNINKRIDQKEPIPTRHIHKLWVSFDRVLALNLFETPKNVSQNLQNLLNQRQFVRDNKDYAASDRLRDQIKDLGYDVKDTDQGQIISKI